MPLINGLPVNKMSSTATKLPLTASRVLLLSTAVFIFLSGSEAKEIRKCYWCGPLAEQVHRSQRAPPCDSVEYHVTNCDPGYGYCAIVATSPPFVESRYCVKLYQDECYSLFCNSTKTWRMTCPCRGDLCNGRNSEREKEAFNSLVKITAKTINNVRVKRAIISSSNLINNGNNTMNNIITETNNSMTPETIKDISNADVDNVTDAIPPDHPVNDVPKEIISTAQKNITDNYNIDEDVKVMNNVTPELNNHAQEISERIEISSLVDKTVEMGTTLEDRVSKLEEIKLSTVATTNVAVEQLPKEIFTVKYTVQTTEKLPTAEALQQNTTPVEKTKQKMTTETTVTETTMIQVNTNMSVVPTSSKNNTGIKLQNQFPSLIACIILNQYL